MNDIKITIITPTYNRAHTLPRVYESLKNQTFKDFKWLIMDDGSTDNTSEVVKQFQQENILNINYYKKENSKKFHTVFKGVELVKSPYFTVLDSDDAYPKNALQTLFDEVKYLNDSFISVVGNSENEKGELVGDLFPNNGFDGSILEMRYKYKVKGDKHAIFITAPYKKFLKNFDYEFYRGKYAPQKIFFNIYDALGYKTRFINQIVRTYYYDLSDTASMSNDRVKPSSYLGLINGHLSFINNYKSQLFSYPKALIRNLIGYQFYAFKNHEHAGNIIARIENPIIKVLGVFLLPFSFVYYKMK